MTSASKESVSCRTTAPSSTGSSRRAGTTAASKRLETFQSRNGQARRPVEQITVRLRHWRAGAESRASVPDLDAPVSFLHKKFKPIGASSGYRIVSLFLPGHLVPAPFFNGFSSLPTTYLLECFQFLVMIRLLHKLSDADRRLTRQDRLFGPRLGRAGGCPATPRKADDHCDDCPRNHAPNTILN